MIFQQAWVDAKQLADGELAGLPAHRVWADVLLQLAAEDRKPDLALRVGALTGVLVEPPTSGRSPIQVEADDCAVAPVSDGLWLFRAAAWAGPLREHLADLYEPSGVDIREHVLPCTPGNLMRAESGWAAVSSTRADLLEDIRRYFQQDVDAYLAGWRPVGRSGLSELGPDHVELVIPWSAVRR